MEIDVLPLLLLTSYWYLAQCCQYIGNSYNAFKFYTQDCSRSLVRRFKSPRPPPPSPVNYNNNNNNPMYCMATSYVKSGRDQQPSPPMNCHMKLTFSSAQLNCKFTFSFFQTFYKMLKGIRLLVWSCADDVHISLLIRPERVTDVICILSLANPHRMRWGNRTLASMSSTSRGAKSLSNL